MYSVICFSSESAVQDVCVGFIGGDTSRFCLKPASHSRLSNCCTTAKHLSDKFSVQINKCYIVNNSTSAFSAPEGDVSHLSPSQIEARQNERRPMSEWQHIFTFQDNAKVKSESKDDRDHERKLKLIDKRVVLQTPAKMRLTSTIKRENDEEDTFFDTETGTRFEVPEESKSAWTQLPDSFKSFFSTLVLGVSDISAQTFGLMRDIRSLEKSNVDVGMDLETLDARYQALQGQVGDTLHIGSIEVPNVNAALGVLLERISMNETALNELNGSLNGGLQGVVNDTKAFESTQRNRWLGLAPLIQQIKEVIKVASTHPVELLYERIERLETKHDDRSKQDGHNQQLRSAVQDDIFNSLFTTAPAINKTQVNDVAIANNHIARIQEDINTLMARTSGDRFKMRNFNFQSVEELRIWVKQHVCGHRFGLFVDGVSLWEHYRHGYFSMPEVLASMRDTTRVGFATVQEARVATSFENLLPAILGKGGDHTKSLPGLPNQKAWDAGDGNNGLRFQLNEFNTNVYTQLADQIQNTFELLSSPAKTLALECLQQSIQFVNELANYITRFHAELLNSGSFSPEQCWQLVCRCVKRCFHDMGAVRITAKDGRLESDPLATATTYIWGTLKTHSIMQEYLKYNFEDHSAFASGITRFVTNNNYQANLKGLTDRVDKQEKALTSLSKRIDTIFNRVSILEKKVE